MSAVIGDGGPAFPCMPPQDTAAGAAVGYPYPAAGMTLRDYLAAKAMQGMLSCYRDPIEPAASLRARLDKARTAEEAYSWADAMLKASQA